MKIHVTKIVRSENVLLAVFSPNHGWAGPAVADGQPQMFPGREEKTVDLWVTSPIDAAKQLGLVVPDNQPPC